MLQYIDLIRRQSVVLLIGLLFVPGFCGIAQAQSEIPVIRGAGKFMAPEAQEGLIEQYCAYCHNPVDLSGGMTLTDLDISHPESDPDLAEKIIGKVKAGLMPPPGQLRPPKQTLDAFGQAIEIKLDRLAAESPNPGTRILQRLTRDEYANSIQDLLGVQVQVSKYLPADMPPRLPNGVPGTWSN